MMMDAAVIDAPLPFERTRAALTAIAVQCDTLCLKVGAELCEAVPALNDLSGQLSLLAETLGGTRVLQACEQLRGLANDIGAITEGLKQEGQGLKSLATDNKKLAKLIEVVAEDIRFLSAMITNVKIEACSVDLSDQGLQAFADDLARLASNAHTTISTCQSTHNDLLTRIDRATKLHASFEENRQTDLEAIAGDFDVSVAAVDKRRAMVSAAASDISSMTRVIGDQVGQCVLALQIGDNIRQRVEHVGEALAIIGDATEETLARFTQEARDSAVAETCRLQVMQLSSAAREFATEVGGVARHLAKIHTTAGDLRLQSHRLVAGDARTGSSFLGDLEARLQKAYGLVDEYRSSRVKIDEVIGAVASTFVELEMLGNKVSAMVVDMTIIGMNAIVRSYGLGQRGAGLSVIAQHLRSQAMKVSDGIKVLAPTITGLRDASSAFVFPTGQGFEHLSRLEDGLGSVLSTFDSLGTDLEAVVVGLDTNVGTLDVVLPTALADLKDAQEIENLLAREVDGLESRAVQRPSARHIAPETHPALDALLMPLYTMSVERDVHNRHFGRRSPPPSAGQDSSLDDALLDALF